MKRFFYNDISIFFLLTGFSLGDELGFAESLGNVEGGRRRSIGYKNGPPPNAIGVLPGNQQVCLYIIQIKLNIYGPLFPLAD